MRITTAYLGELGLDSFKGEKKWEDLSKKVKWLAQYQEKLDKSQ